MKYNIKHNKNQNKQQKRLNNLTTNPKLQQHDKHNTNEQTTTVHKLQTTSITSKHTNKTLQNVQQHNIRYNVTIKTLYDKKIT